MSLIVNGTEIENVIYNGTELTELVFNGVKVWEKILADQLSRLIDGTITEVTAEDLQGITTIGMYAFSHCSSLTNVTIPNGVTSINGGAFQYCSALKKITIPSSVTSIGGLVCSNCTALETVKVLATTPPTLGSLLSDTITRIEVPSASLSAYQNAEYWSSYAGIMVGV